MKIDLLTIETSRELWLDECLELYVKKISPFVKFDVIKIKNKSSARSDAAGKKEQDSDLLLAKIKPSDFVILCDEKGQSLDSIQFSQKLVQQIESGRSHIIFIIGGAYGASEALKKRANMQLSFSKLTFNHLVAQAVLCEQIYRALTIWKGLPYHNM